MLKVPHILANRSNNRSNRFPNGCHTHIVSAFSNNAGLLADRATLASGPSHGDGMARWGWAKLGYTQNRYDIRHV